METGWLVSQNFKTLLATVWCYHFFFFFSILFHETFYGHFEIIFVDTSKDGYAGYAQTIGDRTLLPPGGITLCDDGSSLDFISNPSSYFRRFSSQCARTCAWSKEDGFRLWAGH